MTFLQALEEQKKIEQEVEISSERLRKYPTLPNGLTPDAVRETMQFKSDKRAFDIAFSKLRNFNAVFVKQFKKELKLHRKRV
jgi:hypothetical protein